MKTSTVSFNLSKGKEKFNLPIKMWNIIGFQVKSLTWKIPPFDPINTSILWVSSDTLQKSVSTQSGAFFSSATPFIQSQFIYKSIIAHYTNDELQKKFNNEKPAYFFVSPLNFEDVDFKLESDADGLLNFNTLNNVWITIDFFQ
jgi:hypothetical protein